MSRGPNAMSCLYSRVWRLTLRIETIVEIAIISASDKGSQLMSKWMVQVWIGQSTCVDVLLLRRRITNNIQFSFHHALLCSFIYSFQTRGPYCVTRWDAVYQGRATFSERGPDDTFRSRSWAGVTNEITKMRL